MKILCVEDGSIDIEGLEKEPLRDGKILVYRQGAKPPFVLEMPDNKFNETEIRADERKKVCQQIKELIDPIFRQNVIALRHDIEDIIDKIGGKSK